MGFFTTLLAALGFRAGGAPIPPNFPAVYRTRLDATTRFRGRGDALETYRTRTDAETVYRARGDA